MPQDSTVVACSVVFFILVLLLCVGTGWSNSRTHSACKQTRLRTYNQQYPHEEEKDNYRQQESKSYYWVPFKGYSWDEFDYVNRRLSPNKDWWKGGSLYRYPNPAASWSCPGNRCYPSQNNRMCQSGRTGGLFRWGSGWICQPENKFTPQVQALINSYGTPQAKKLQHLWKIKDDDRRLRYRESRRGLLGRA